jgi:cell division protein ZapE
MWIITLPGSPKSLVETDNTKMLVPKDDSQAQAIKLLNQIGAALPIKKIVKSEGLFSSLFKKQVLSTAPKGLYLWGGVGRGKTWLMDQFYQSVPITGKMRLHFHHFIKLLHKEMNSIPPGENSLDIVMRKFANQYQLLCLDEFQISDIGDAILLQGALQGLFENGVVLVTTSNRQPDHLYKGGVLCEQMLPSIKLLKQHCSVFHLDGDSDYRLENKSDRPDWFVLSSDKHAENKLNDWFDILSTGDVKVDISFEINNRVVQARKLSESCAWFDFDQLCKGPRAVSDYIHLAEHFSSLIVSSVPVLHEALESAARRFMHLVDELYDRRIRLVIAADVPLEELYSGDVLNFEFQRTLSRLYDMQSPGYLQDAPLMKLSSNKHKEPA